MIDNSEKVKNTGIFFNWYSKHKYEYLIDLFFWEEKYKQTKHLGKVN